MPTIEEMKEQAILETPLLLFDCQLPNGEMERWSTHGVTLEGRQYSARVLRHNLFDIRACSEDGIDGVGKVSLTLANADSRFSQIERGTGWKGAKLTVRFVFFNLKTGTPESEEAAVFSGVANPPDEITESTFRLTFTNRLSMQRAQFPQVRIQRRCPWVFPRSAAEREEAANGGELGKYSPFYRCGYSADVTGGVGNLQQGAVYTDCGYTQADCAARGMFDADEGLDATRRFGGIRYVPPSVTVRSYGEKGTHTASTVENEARYNDFVPLVYGTAWYEPPTVFARNDGNLTHMEVLLGMGEIQGVVKVVVNQIEIPQGQAGADMTATGWYNLVSTGGRTGAFNLDFVDAGGSPAGDPYGSMALLSVVVPNRISEGKKLPDVQVLVEGLKLAAYSESGEYLGESFTNNPAWVILDLLRRSGWELGEIDVASFARAAERCAEAISAQDVYGNLVSIPRFQCNLVVRKRRSAADLIRGIRTGCRLYLTLGPEGKLELAVEDTMARQQPVKPTGSNSTELLDGGWPAYEFGDGSNGFGGILRRANGEPSLRIYSRSTGDTPNRFTVEFQDAFNEYQQDSLSLVDIADVLKVRQEISGTLSALGLPNADQAARIVRLHLDRSVRGNTLVEFETSVKGLHLRPGDLITVSYLKEGLERQPFRVIRVTPGTNYRKMQITAQIHWDEWYSDVSGLGGSGARRESGAEVGIPRPLIGSESGEVEGGEFGVTESVRENADGSACVALSVEFWSPEKPATVKVGRPLLSLSPAVLTSGGTLEGGQNLYYAVSALDSHGNESALSFVVRASIPTGTNTNMVRLQGLSFSQGTAAYRVYRGPNPTQLYRIASNEPVAGTFEDIGQEAQGAGPADADYDHANFYWRLELVPEHQATIHGPNQIGNTSLGLLANEYRGATVRITRGKGARQERTIASHSEDTITLTSAWHVTPDATSYFVVSESSWHFGARVQGSPAEFEAPNRAGATIQIVGRSANVSDQECAYELSPLTRWRLGGASGSALDAEAPPEPTFGLSVAGAGVVELQGIGFPDLDNTRTVSSGTLGLWYWDELSGESAIALSAGVDEGGEYVDLGTAGPASAGDLIQVESELMAVQEVQNGGSRYKVTRATHETNAAGHAAGTRVYHLARRVSVVAFSRDFFGSPASGSFTYRQYLADARIAAAELFVTNSRGNSPTARKNFTSTVDKGLRTLSGGQFSIQVEGPLAMQTEAAPPLVVDQGHAVRDVFARVREAPVGGAVELRIRQGTATYCELTIAAGATISNTVDGLGLAPLEPGAVLKLDVLSVAQGEGSYPGADLTVTVRL